MAKVERRSLGGRPKSFSDEELEKLRALILAEPSLTLRALALSLIHISEPTRPY